MNMTLRRIAYLAALLLLMLSAALSLRAAPPQTIAYQGFLTSNTGVPVNANMSMVFSLYNVANGGTALWSETQSVTVTNGVYTVVFGNITQITLPFDAQYYLGVKVGTDAEMTPRPPLTAVPYAFRAAKADTATSASTVSGTIAGSQVTGAISGAQISGLLSNAIVPGSQISGTITGATMQGATPWVAVAGTNQSALSNTAYIVSGSTLATIVLPASPAVGDVVKVSAPFAGGFTVVPNAGQSIIGGMVALTLRNGAGGIYVASSADGTKLVALAPASGSSGGRGSTSTSGYIYTSTDSGVTWTLRDTSASGWTSVASSADGTKLVAVEAGVSDRGLPIPGGYIYTSTDSGVTWTLQASAPLARWISVASSADGSKLIAADGGPGQIYTSTDSGVTWSARDSARAWVAVASSLDGMKLVAAEFGGLIYTSTDSGVTWTARDSAKYWMAVASSTDGTRLVAAAGAIPPSGTPPLGGGLVYGYIYTSTDSGLTWILQANAPLAQWRSIASSNDGTKLLAVAYAGQIYTSTDSGVTWTPRDSARSWTGVACSGDGMSIVAVTGDQIYTAGPSVSGLPGTSVEVVYTGNGQWILVNQQGTLKSP
jgi:hypothetical protein